MEKRDQHSRSRRDMAGVIFTAAMILCCALLYLLGRGGEQPQAAKNSASEEPVLEPGRVYPAEAVFWERAWAGGLSGEPAAVAGYEPSRGYSLSADGEELGRLVLSMRSGGVCAFSLITPLSTPPGELPEDATLIERDVYESRAAEYEAALSWRMETYSVLTGALDIMDELSYADRAEMQLAVQRALEEQKTMEHEAAGFEMSALTLSEGGGSVFIISLGIIEE